jgi:hypothetical protein
VWVDNFSTPQTASRRPPCINRGGGGVFGVLGTLGSVLEHSNSYMLSGICILLFESNSSAMHERLQVWTLGDLVASRCACYSWRLPPPRRLGGLWTPSSTPGVGAVL